MSPELQLWLRVFKDCCRELRTGHSPTARLFLLSPENIFFDAVAEYYEIDPERLRAMIRQYIK